MQTQSPGNDGGATTRTSGEWPERLHASHELPSEAPPWPVAGAAAVTASPGWAWPLSRTETVLIAALVVWFVAVLGGVGAHW